MSSLTGYLQREFERLSPPDWRCFSEISLLAPDLEDLLGYAPRADVLLERPDGSERLWIEFEVSRADPVANHAKFATAHLFSPQLREDAFVSMVSPHVTRGRRNLAANTIQLMRHIGMNAFQTVLFPHLSSLEIKRLNHLDEEVLSEEQPDVEPEIERVLVVSRPVLAEERLRLHFAGDIGEVMLSLRGWNEDILPEEGRGLWGRRVVTYFVFSPSTLSFAPSKFCAYVPVFPSNDIVATRRNYLGAMTMDVYSRLDQATKIFDGTRARIHLTRRLGMIECTPAERPEAAIAFERWLDKHHQSICVSATGPVFLVPPPWFS